MTKNEMLTIQQVEPVTCPATAYQRARVCVPVAVRPFATPLATTTVCCGDPVIAPLPTIPPLCPGTLNGACTFTLTQDICIEVPVEFGANTRVGGPFVQCGRVSDVDICTGCGDDAAGFTDGCQGCI